MKHELLRMDHITLSQSGELFLDNLSFQMFAGEIMGLIAQNNKGCDQLVSLICNNQPIDFGTVWYDGQIVNSYFCSGRNANRVYVIEQKSHLVEGLSIADNLFVLRKGFRKYYINESVLSRQAASFLQENGIRIDMAKRVASLTPLERSLVELGKALLSGCRLVIVDNPGNFLSQHDLTEFQQMLKRIRDEGISILYIGNHHQEVFRIADRTSLFSGGRIVKIFEKGEMTDQNIEPYITDWNIREPELEPDPESEDGILHFHRVCAGSLRKLRFVLHKGECLTLLDMDKRIAEDILRLLTGQTECREGWITLEHEPYTAQRASGYLDEGIAIIPQDCAESLLFRNKTYMENLTFLLDRKLGKSLIPGKIYRSIRREFGPLAGPAINAANITSLPLQEQIALVYYRMLLFSPRVLVCIQPLAKGDMYTRMKILKLLRGFLDRGTAVLIITANISDTLDISDRLLVVEDGTCTAVYEKQEFDRIAATVHTPAGTSGTARNKGLLY